MRTLNSIELLRVWEDGIHFTLTERSLQLLSIACGVPDLNNVADWSIGERDARLLQLREWMFGSRLLNKANCPKCGELLEWTTELEDIRLQAPKQQTLPQTFELDVEGTHINFRLPNSHDVFRATSDPAYSADPQKLLAECIVAASNGVEEIAMDKLPGDTWDALEQQMEKLDPQADIQMALTCPACAHEWSASFDIAGYLWTEIDNWAKHVMQEVYLLARSFHWSEQDILKMSPRRRQLYIEMIS